MSGLLGNMISFCSSIIIYNRTILLFEILGKWANKVATQSSEWYWIIFQFKFFLSFEYHYQNLD